VNRGERVQITVDDDGQDRLFSDDAGAHRVQIHPSRQSIRSATIDNRQVEFGVVHQEGTYHIYIDGIDYTVSVVDARFEKLLELGGTSGSAGGQSRVCAPIPGLVVRILVEEGQQVTRDQPLLILDAMKLENEILSPADGEVTRVAVAAGQAVEKDALLLEVS